VNAADKQGHTALGWAKQAGSNDVVELLRQHGGHE
jgi:ankyrin repeat protein